MVLSCIVILSVLCYRLFLHVCVVIRLPLAVLFLLCCDYIYMHVNLLTFAPFKWCTVKFKHV